MEFEFGTDDDDGATGIIDALAEEILTEAALLAFEHIGERFEWAIAGTGDGSAAPSVIDEGVDGLLEHTLFIANDNIWSLEFEKAIKAIIAINDAAIEVVEIGSGESAAVELNHRAQFWGDNGDNVHNHPFGAIAGFAEGFDDFESANGANAFLTVGGIEFVAEFLSEGVEVKGFKKELDSLRAHADFEGIAAEFFFFETELTFGEEFLRFHIGIAGIKDNVRGEVKNALQSAGRHIEQKPHAGGDTFEVPDMRDGCGEFDMAHAFSANFSASDFDAAAVADSAFIADAFIFTAMAFPIASGTENAFAEEAVAFGLEGAIVDSFGLFNFAVRPFANFLWRGEANAHGVEKINVEHSIPP